MASKKEKEDETIRTLKEQEMRQWMTKRGLGNQAKVQMYTDDERRILIKFYEQLDHDGDGQVTADELSEVLTALGLAETYGDVWKLLSQVDKDRDGLIDFNEFISMVQNSTQSKAVFLVMQQMIRMEQRESALAIPLPTAASTFRRRMLMASMMDTGEKQQHGRRFMKSFTRTVTANMVKREKAKAASQDKPASQGAGS
jgi:hypothetical protein